MHKSRELSPKPAPLARNFQGIRSVPPLGPAEERELARRIQAGDRRALDRLVLSHLGFVAKLAGRYGGNGAPVEDLFNEGALGLIEAAERFDPDRGRRFLTYAVFWIRKSMLTALKLYSNQVRLPDSLHRRASREGQRPMLTIRSPARAPQPIYGEQSLEFHLRLSPHHLSMDHVPDPDSQQPLRERLHDVALRDAEEDLIGEETRRTLLAGVTGLDDQARFVILRRFGFLDGRCWTLERLGAHMELSRERVRQIELKARGDLRRKHRQIPALWARPDAVGSSH